MRQAGHSPYASEEYMRTLLLFIALTVTGSAAEGITGLWTAGALQKTCDGHIHDERGATMAYCTGVVIGVISASEMTYNVNIIQAYEIFSLYLSRLIQNYGDVF
jgi:hypothetical protein